MNLSVIALGHVHTEAFEPLTKHLERLEQVVTNLSPRVRFAEWRAELNRAIDAAANDWILILREREIIDDALAAEIALSVAQPSPAAVSPAGAGQDRGAPTGTTLGHAWGYRMRTVPIYAGRPLRLAEEYELRLLHRRHLLRRGELAVEGPVIRLRNSLHAITFDSAEGHRSYLEKRGVPHSTVRRVLLFLRNARTLDVNTLRYLWIEAGFDRN